MIDLEKAGWIVGEMQRSEPIPPLAMLACCLRHAIDSPQDRDCDLLRCRQIVARLRAGLSELESVFAER